MSNSLSNSLLSISSTNHHPAATQPLAYAPELQDAKSPPGLASPLPQIAAPQFRPNRLWAEQSPQARQYNAIESRYTLLLGEAARLVEESKWPVNLFESQERVLQAVGRLYQAQELVDDRVLDMPDLAKLKNTPQTTEVIDKTLDALFRIAKQWTIRGSVEAVQFLWNKAGMLTYVFDRPLTGDYETLLSDAEQNQGIWNDIKISVEEMQFILEL